MRIPPADFEVIGHIIDIQNDVTDILRYPHIVTISFEDTMKVPNLIRVILLSSQDFLEVGIKVNVRGWIRAYNGVPEFKSDYIVKVEE